MRANAWRFSDNFALIDCGYIRFKWRLVELAQAILERIL